MAVRTFDGAVLVRQAPIVAGRLHAVMSAQRLVASRLVLPRVIVEIAEGSRQTVAAVLQRGLAERPQRIGAQLRMATPDLVENRHWPQARRALQQRHHLAVPN